MTTKPKILILFTFCYLGLAKTIKHSEFNKKNCRNGLYSRSQVERFCVSVDLVSWSKQYPDYKPPFYESPYLKGKPWADPSIDDSSFEPNFNRVGGRVNRASFTGEYKIQGKYPMNPSGRTGIAGRGYLGRWGPNHAADTLVTRWSQSANGTINTDPVTGSPILQMIAIHRRDNNMWAIPGGMIEEGETPFQAAKREFYEEALHGSSDEDISSINRVFDDHLKEIHGGFVYDCRNTDNAWVETTAFHFHDENGESVAHLHFKAGDDVKNLKWLDVHKDIDLHVDHRKIVKKVVDVLEAHW